MAKMTKQEMISAIAPLEDDYYPCEEITDKIKPVTIVTITAPRGMGKDTVRKVTGYPFVTSEASRDIRPGEVDGEDYNFVEQPAYHGITLAVEQGLFVQWGLGISKEEFYGTRAPAYPSQGPAVLDVIPSQVPYMRSLPFMAHHNFYLTAKDTPTWRTRWAGRPGAMDEDQIKKSLIEAETSLEWGLASDDVTFVMNDTVEQAALDIRTAVETPHRYTKYQETLARNAGTSILRDLKMELGSPISV